MSGECCLEEQSDVRSGTQGSRGFDLFIRKGYFGLRFIRLCEAVVKSRPASLPPSECSGKPGCAEVQNVGIGTKLNRLTGFAARADENRARQKLSRQKEEEEKQRPFVFVKAAKRYEKLSTGQISNRCPRSSAVFFFVNKKSCGQGSIFRPQDFYFQNNGSLAQSLWLL